MAPKKPAESGKQKRELLLLEVKEEIILKPEQGVREYGKTHSTISTVLKDKEKIMGHDKFMEHKAINGYNYEYQNTTSGLER